MIWTVIAFLTALAALSVLVPLARGRTGLPAKLSSRAFFEGQLEELERERERGLLSEAEYTAARAETARRLIAADREKENGAGFSIARKRIAALAALLVVPAVAIGLYVKIGKPALPDRPLEARLSAPPDRIELIAAVAKIEKHLRRNPDDGKGWQVIAPIYMRMQRYEKAAEALQNVLRILGPTADRFGSLGEALVFANKGGVNDQALAAFAQALKIDPRHNQSLFFTGLAAQQAGDNVRAREYWTQLIAAAPKGAPWVKSLQQRMAELDSATRGPSSEAGKAIAALPQEERTAAIRSMVDGLAARLKDNPKDLKGWMMLLRAYMVLKQPDKAREALSTARNAFVGDAASLQQLDAQAKALSVESKP